MINRINIILGILIFSGVVLAADLPTTPEAYYGTISGASSGLTITAKIGSTTVGTYTLLKNNYYGNKSAASSDGKLIVCAKGESVCTSGATITFTASSGSISTTSTFTPGAITNLDLNYTAPSAVASAGGGAGAGGGGGAGVSKPSVTITPVTDITIINILKTTLPEGWDNVRYDQYGDIQTSTKTVDVVKIDNALSYAISDKAISVLQNLRNSIESAELSPITVTTTLTVYKIQNKDTGEEIYRSKIDITFTAQSNMENVQIIEVVPKTVASSTDNFVFPELQPIILQKDPILQWVIDKINKGETKKFTYIVKKQLSKIESTTLSSGKIVELVEKPPVEEEKPPIEEKKPEVKPPVKKQIINGIIIVVVIVIIGLIIYLLMTRKKE
jgi:hypothetical protein